MRGGNVDYHIDAAERQCLESIDPFMHFVMLESVATENSLPFSIADKETGTELPDHTIIEEIRRSESQREKHRTALKRVFRYFASETMVLMLLSGHPFGPFVRITSVLRSDRLNQAFLSLSKKEVPQGFSARIDGVDLSFDEWISFRVTGDPAWLEGNDMSHIVQLIVEEADLLSERAAINAFKHCRPLSIGQSPRFTFTVENKADRLESPPIQGINWLEWREKKDELSLTYRTEEVDGESDYQRLFCVCLLLNHLKGFRLAQLTGSVSDFDATLPTDFKIGQRVKRQKITFNYGSEECAAQTDGAE